MTDYTPTTEEVKANFALVGDDEVVNNINEQKFDRWLAQHDAEVAKATEERIIKLLDTYQLPHWAPTKYIEYTEGYITGFGDALALIQGEELVGIDPKLIALIKGENK